VPPSMTASAPCTRTIVVREILNELSDISMHDRQFQRKVGTGVPLDQPAIVVVGRSWPDTADKAKCMDTSPQGGYQFGRALHKSGHCDRRSRRFWIARKPETHLFSTAACSTGSCRVDCERELAPEPEANFRLGVLLPGMYDRFLSLVSPSGRSIGHTHMPKFLRIGVHQSNVSGYTSKAWWVRRVGSTVFLKWGAVEVHGVGDGRKIYWTLPPRAKTIRCGTVQRAKDYARTAIARRRSHRYEPLAGNIAIRRRPANRGAELEQALATILFVDIVRSTENAARLGDSRWTQVMNHYYAAVRRELKTLRGKEVVTTGDGLLATFDAPASGVRCATAIREAVRTLGLEIRVGLHAGEYKVSGADVVGLAFHIGARVAAKARAGEVLVSSAVKNLMSQSGIRFKDRGVHRLKGVPERWRLYRVEP
jgi:class 3 adenylate cyclase